MHSELKVSAAAVDDESSQDNEKHNCGGDRPPVIFAPAWVPTDVIYFSSRRFTSPRTCETMRGRAGLRARGPLNSRKPPPGAHAETP